MVKKKSKTGSELRMDLISKNWVIVASGREKKPNYFKKPSSEKCPFCGLKTQKKPLYIKGSFNNWTTAVVPNLYPVVASNFEFKEKIEGKFYKKMPALGFHEVLITRDHKKQLAELPLKRVEEVIEAWQKRYLALENKKFVNHISIFQNHGPESGASMTHPHSQIITTYLVDVDLKNALNSAKKYHKENKKCLYCQMTKHDLKVKERIVFENNSFVALCPFASKRSFQVIITPKKHLSYFQKINNIEKKDLAESLKVILSKFKKGLNDPSYNFYLHTAPCDGKKHDYYHWHFTILPKTQEWAGFEMGAQLEIINIRPEDAAKYLRKI